MVPNKLKRHLKQNHCHISKKVFKDYFKHLLLPQKEIQF